MKSKLLIASAALALAACGGNGSQVDPANNAMNDLGTEAGNETMPGNDGAAAGADPDAPTASTGQEYATMAAASDLYEIESARLATERTQNAGIRELAQMIVTDHERSTAELRTAAQQAQPPITVSPEMNPEQQADMEALRSATATEFDRLYLEQQVAAHRKALNLVQHYAQNGDAAPLRQHASTVAGPIQTHLERARTLSQQDQ